MTTSNCRYCKNGSPTCVSCNDGGGNSSGFSPRMDIIKGPIPTPPQITNSVKVKQDDSKFNKEQQLDESFINSLKETKVKRKNLKESLKKIETRIEFWETERKYLTKRENILLVTNHIFWLRQQSNYLSIALPTSWSR